MCGITDGLGAWSGLDLTVLCIGTAFLQIGKFATFVVGHTCDTLIPLLETPKVDKLLDHEDYCLNVACTFLPGMWWLVAAAALTFGVTQFVAIKARAQLSYKAEPKRSRMPSINTIS